MKEPLLVIVGFAVGSILTLGACSGTVVRLSGATEQRAIALGLGKYIESSQGKVFLFNVEMEKK